MSNDPLDVKSEKLSVHSDLDEKGRETLAVLLNDFLASSYVLYAKTHAFHWNVTGPLFYSVHKLTDEQYQDLAEAIDAIAERVRSIGFPALSGLHTYVQKSLVKEPREMLQHLAQDHQALAHQARETVREAEKFDDVYTADLLTARIGFHEEAAWMLNALLAE